MARTKVYTEPVAYAAYVYLAGDNSKEIIGRVHRIAADVWRAEAECPRLCDAHGFGPTVLGYTYPTMAAAVDAVGTWYDGEVAAAKEVAA